MTEPADSADSLDSLENRLSVVERELSHLRDVVSRDHADVVAARADAEAARVLAAGADHDVAEVRAELRAHLRALNALRETQLEQQTRMDDGFARMDTGFAKVNAGLVAITLLLERNADDDSR